MTTTRFDGGGVSCRDLATAAGCVFAATLLFRYLALTGFPNDQFEHLAGAQQMLFGEWPTRDFLDPGMPLMYAVSAGAQLLFGRTLFAEAVLDSSMLSLAAACTLVGACRVSRSMLVAVAVTILSILIFPRPYAYPRLLMTAVGPLAMWAWASRPTLTRLVWLAATTVVALLFRYDYAAYVGIGALVTLVATPADGWRQVLRRVATFGGLLVLLLTPYVIFLGGYDALADSLLRFVVYGSRHAGRNALRLDNLGTVYEAGLFYGFHAMPFVALASLSVDRIRRRASPEWTLILPLTVLAMTANYFLIGNTLSSRLPDAVVPNMLLFAWLAGRASRVTSQPARWAAVGASVLVFALGADAVTAIGDTTQQIDRTGLTASGVQGIATLMTSRTAELTSRFSPRQVPDGGVVPLVPFFEYLDRCTTTDHRLFVAGYIPQIFVYARRMFGGGEKVFLQGSFASDADQQLIVDRLNRQVVVFSLAYSDEYEPWREDFPRVAAFVASHFTPMAEIPVGPDRTVKVQVNTGMPPLGTDAATGWPCYR